MSSPFEKHIVLMVDDNPELLESVAFALRKLANIQVETALDGVTGLERIIELRPSCVIIDVKMPGLDGNQLIRALRGDPETASLPLIILSAMVQPQDQFMGRVSGADVYLTKPLNIQDLLDAINHAITLSDEDRARRLQDMVDESL